MGDLRQRTEYTAARAAVTRPGRYGEIAEVGHGIDIERPGEVSVFVSHWEEAVDMTPAEAREMAWALFVAADLAEQADREDGR
jgi:hypothetical protein